VTRAAGAAGLLAVVFVFTACGGDDDRRRAAPRPSGAEVKTAAGVATPYGLGASQVWVLRPARGEVRSAVVYVHGWGAALPFEWHLAWFDHLLSRGSAVIFPRYQGGSADDPLVTTPLDLRLGLELGFRALDEDGIPVVAAGFSVGATLAFVYAAQARVWALPRPEAVYAIFPIDPVAIDPTLDVAPARGTRLLLLVGEDDAVVGRAGADAIWSELRSLPASAKELRVVRTTDDLLADHEAPTYVRSEAVRRTFWAPLDRLVEQARS
jgi:acetyl esterase/lipase